MNTPQYWAVVPAAGVGSRMGTELPKQYLTIAGMRVIEHTLGRICAHPRISGVMVAVAKHDPWFELISVKGGDRLHRVTGGEQRCHSVLNGLMALTEMAAGEDWVLVHDAARPCLCPEDIDRLMVELDGHPVGGLLATRVRDTMKRSDADGTVTDTVSREGLWHALTPQMFRLGPLRDALSKAVESGQMVTDEAQAMELVGAMPKLVEGNADNIKITTLEDFRMAVVIFRRQQEEGCGDGCQQK